MYTSTCPRCHDALRVPAENLPADAQARCPWCGEEFPLADVINRLPPVVQILSVDSVAAGAVAVTSPEAPQLDVESFELTDDEPAIDETVAFVGDNTLANVDIEADSEVVQPVTTAPNVQAKPRKKSGGGLRGLLGVVAGGLLAIPIAGGVLWGLGTLGYGPLATSDGIGSKRVASTPIPRPMPTSSSVTAGEDVADTMPSDAEPPAAIEQPLTLPDDADSGETDSLTTDSNDTTDEPLASPDREVEVVELDTLSTESDELVKQVATAIKMINAIDNLEPDDTRRTKYLATTYRNIALAAELATSNGPKLQALAQTVKQSKSLADFETEAAEVDRRFYAQQRWRSDHWRGRRK